MRCIYFDCFSGISGDMTLGALFDLGVPPKYVREELKKLAISGYSINVSDCKRMGLAGKKVFVRIAKKQQNQPGRSYRQIEKIIKKSPLKSHIKDKSLAIFSRIAQAEARIHQKKIQEIHFHEVGALDSIVDIVGAVIGFDYLEITSFYASPVPLGSGFVRCKHGTLPVPAPATLAILKGTPVYAADIRGELVTPTGAAILTTFVKDFGMIPPMIIKGTGYGAGTSEFQHVPNMLRIILGETQDIALHDQVMVLETNIDDMNPEWTGFLMERLLDAGALDVAIIPLYMKKNRPGMLLQVICSAENQALLVRIIFEESTAAGVRYYTAGRTKLLRRQGKLKTKFGSLQVKVFKTSQGETMVPEFEECRRVAIQKGVALKEVYREILSSPKRGGHNVK